MAFWGIEVKPGKPYIHRYDDEKGRLHISQATLGTGSSDKKGVVQCNVGDKKPVYLCSLLSERLETCALNLEFDEDDGEVTFSVHGSQSVHLSGFFYGEAEDHDHPCDDCDSDPYEDGVMMTDSEDESVYDSEDEDEYIDDDFGMYPSSPISNNGVKNEEIVDDEKPTNENGVSKRAKKKKSQLSTSEDNENSINDEKVGEKTEKKIEKDDVAPGKNLKRKIDDVGQDGEPASEKIEPRDTVISENKDKKNKKKKVDEKVESAQESKMPKSNGVAEMGNDKKPSEKKKDEKKKKQDKQQEIEPTPNGDEKQADKKGSEVEKQNKVKSKSLQVRTFPNGLVTEVLVMGKPNGKRASKGKKVSVHYIGKLKKNGKIFHSNIGKSPFKFRLGIGQVIKGWDVGVNGMRVGDKRRLTIPPALGYGAKGAGLDIPRNSWLVFDVELIDVK